jgi:putative transposase
MVDEVLGVARSSYDYRPVAPPDEAQLTAAIKKTAAEWPTYGYRRITGQLRRGERRMNYKRVQRLMRWLGLQAQLRRKKRRTTNSDHSFPRYPNRVLDLEVMRPEQVWVCDITYIRLRYGFVYLAVIMDVFTQGIRGWHLGPTWITP